ncbi:MAG: hypothetical protein SRB2_00196 [Desulfobacteraceae bacterium Eth-SRB2]|nr:MAG: hypothetical protein SRB2_00196 [Desulfobacteraceae bacterium Eth-SRB2]
MNSTFIKKIGSIVFVMVLLLCASSAWALTATQVAKLVAADGASGDLFGYSVAVDGDTAVIGAWADVDAGVSSGSAYVFTRDAIGDWSQQAKLLAGDGASADFFGWSVAVDGDTAVIGAWADDDAGVSSGSAYVFTRNAIGDWSQQAKLLAADGASGDFFGESVAVDGDTAVIGAFYDDENYVSSGSAYVFTRVFTDDGINWEQQAKLLAGDGASADFFGWSVAVDGDTAVIGAWADDDAGVS